MADTHPDAPASPGDERLRAIEARAAELCRRYEALAAHTRDILLYVRRADGRILEVNQAACVAYGRSAEELLRLTVHDLRAPATRPVTAEQMAEADERGILFETVHLRGDGSTFPVEVSSRGATIDGVRVLLSVVRDITQRRRVEEELREANRRREEFLAVLSHELRNPLGPIRNAVQVLERAAPGSAESRRAVEILKRQSDHLARLVDDLLDANRIARGGIALRLEPVDLAGLALRTVEDHRAGFDAAGVELALELAAAPVRLEADPTRLAQVLGNLLDNAAKFTPRGGHVRVALATADGEAVLRVRDDGVGISPADRERLFLPFEQERQALDRSRGGLGLGLTLVRGLVALHGGRISVASDGPGRGTEFEVRLPLLPGPEAPAGQAAGAPRGRRILVIEDNVDAGDSLKDALELMGHAVELARDGGSGLAAARAGRFDVVLCDIGLPDLDGYEVARRFRADPALADVRLVALTGYALPQDRARAIEAGFEAHLAKPASFEELERIVAERSRAERDR
jgi:two-component system CheB/CheR fusion protein